jgi:hypothetical protein
MRISFFSKLLFFLSFYISASAQELPDKLMNHPRILFMEGQEAMIRASIAKSELRQSAHQAIIAEANKMIDLPLLERIQIGRRLLDKSRECLRRVLFLGYAYRMTGDEKYLVRTEEEIIEVANFSDWNPSHFLDVAEMTTGMAIAYDWLYTDLKESTRTLVKKAILEKGINPSLDDEYNGFLTAEHNWNQVCNAGMAFGALAIYEDEPELAKAIIKRAINSIALPMEQFAPDGAYPEGYGYWAYGTTFNVLFNDAIAKCFGTDFGLNALPGFDKTATYLMHMIGPSKKSFNYSDCGNSIKINPAMFWFAEQNQNPSLVYWERKLIQTDIEDGMDNRVFPLMMIWGSGIELEKDIAPKETFWTGSGQTPVALMRSSWDADGIFVGLKAGSPFVNHAHMDIGSFVMDALGERWAMDFGASNYNLLETQGVKIWDREQESQRWDVFRYNNLAHSTLSFDNQLQEVHGYTQIDKTIQEDALNGAMTNMSSLYSSQVKSAKRAVAIIDKAYVLVSDQIENNATAKTMQWRMPTAATVKSMDKNSLVLEQNGKILRLKVLGKHKVNMRTWTTKSRNAYDEPNPNSIMVGFEMELRANSKEEIHVALVPEGSKIPEKVSTGNWFE